MIKFINILSNVISEQKRYKLSPEDYTRLQELTDRLWSLRSKEFPKKVEVDQMEFKTADGSDGKVKIFLSPRYKHYGQMDLKPRSTRNPQKFIMQLNPAMFGSKKNLFLTLYHELMHATDPQFTTKFSEKYFADYDPEVDSKYWGHPIEFRAVTNEFLEALVNEFSRRNSRVRKVENRQILLSSLNNILNYFAKGEPLSKLSLDIFNRLNDEDLKDSRISKLLADIPTNYPETSEMLKSSDPYFLLYINTIKKYNPDMWPRFLKMLYDTVDEIKNIINKGV
jgi:hypothetical protein